MYTADLLISDYSAVMFSFLLTKKPCFLYVPDLENYVNNDRKLYFNISELPFVSAKTNNELTREILNFDMNNYLNKVNKMLEKINTYEDGNASKNLLDRIEKITK